jgi:hypothetical protein
MRYYRSFRTYPRLTCKSVVPHECGKTIFIRRHLIYWPDVVDPEVISNLIAWVGATGSILLITPLRRLVKQPSSTPRGRYSKMLAIIGIWLLKTVFTPKWIRALAFNLSRIDVVRLADVGPYGLPMRKFRLDLIGAYLMSADRFRFRLVKWKLLLIRMCWRACSGQPSRTLVWDQYV